MNIQSRRVFLLVAILGIAVLCAFAARRIAYENGGYYEVKTEEEPILLDGTEAYGFNGCELIDKKIVITGEDPQFVVPANDDEVSMIHILFSEPVAQDISLQVFYAYPGEGFGESHSIHTGISSGSVEKKLTIPEATYSLFRFDFEQSVHLETIYSGNETKIHIQSSLDPIRLMLVFLVVFVPLAVLAFRITRERKVEKEEITGIRGKPVAAIILCNLCLSETVVFFQPMEHMLVHLKDFAFPFERVWWIQLLLSLGVALILSLLMLALPSVAGRVLASLSMGCGMAFLAQALLLNGNRPMAMNKNWPMEILDAFIWIGIVLITVVMTLYYLKEKGKRTERVLRILAIVLIVIQAYNFLILTSAVDAAEKDPGYMRETVYSADSGIELKNMEENMLNISMFRGMPYPMKDSFRYDMDTVNRTPTVTGFD